MASRAKEEDPEKVALRHARAARIRAARAYADLDQAKVADALGVSVITVKRMERGTRDISVEDLHAIADLTKMPRRALEFGFRIVDEFQAPATADELHALRSTFLEALDARMVALTDALLTRDEALAASRQALTRLRQRAEGHDDNGDDDPSG